MSDKAHPLKPFLYAMADIEGKCVFDEFCVSEDANGLELTEEDEACGKKIVPVYTGPHIEAMRDALRHASEALRSQIPKMMHEGDSESGEHYADCERCASEGALGHINHVLGEEP